MCDCAAIPTDNRPVAARMNRAIDLYVKALTQRSTPARAQLDFIDNYAGLCAQHRIHRPDSKEATT